MYRHPYDYYYYLYYHDPIVYLIASIMMVGILLIWGWVSWVTVSKAGYQGISRILLVLGKTIFFPIGNIVFILLPWPVERRLQRLGQRIDEIERSIHFSPANHDVEVELNKMKAELGLTKMKRPKRTPW